MPNEFVRVSESVVYSGGTTNRHPFWHENFPMLTARKFSFAISYSGVQYETRSRGKKWCKWKVLKEV